MTTLYGASRMASDVVLMDRVRVAAVTAAANIAQESASTANHANRSILSFNVLNDSEGKYASLFTWALTSNVTIAGEYNGDQSNIADGDIQFAVNSLWDAMARNDGAS